MLRMKFAHMKCWKQKEKTRRSLYGLSKLHSIYGHENIHPYLEHVSVFWCPGTEEASIPSTACKQQKASRTLEFPKHLAWKNEEGLIHLATTTATFIYLHCIM